MGSTSDRGLFFRRSAPTAWQAASVNGAFFSSLSASVNLPIADKVALIVTKWGKPLFCFEHFASKQAALCQRSGAEQNANSDEA